MNYATYTVTDNFRLRCFKCGSYDTYIENDQGVINLVCDECDNIEKVEFEEE